MATGDADQDVLHGPCAGAGEAGGLAGVEAEDAEAVEEIAAGLAAEVGRDGERVVGEWNGLGGDEGIVEDNARRGVGGSRRRGSEPCGGRGTLGEGWNDGTDPLRFRRRRVSEEPEVTSGAMVKSAGSDANARSEDAPARGESEA